MAVLTRDIDLVRTVSAKSSDLIKIVAGETIATGQAFRIDSSDNLAYLSDAGAGDATSSDFTGYSLGNATVGQNVAAQIGGDIYLGVAAVEGMFYFVSDTPGETEDCSVQAAGNAGQLIGYGNADGSITMKPVKSGGVIPT